jgi:AraC-like DNA-binding protein
VRSRGNERAQFWRDAELDNLEVLHATFVTHRYVPHSHAGFVVALMERGAESFEYRGATHIVPSGSISVLNPGEVHTGQAAVPAGWSYRVLYPSVELMHRAARQLGGRACDVPFFDTPVFADPWLAAQLRQQHNNLAANETVLERESRLLWVLTHLIARHASVRLEPPALGSEPAAVRQARAFLDAHLDQSVTLPQVAAAAGLSPFHLLRVFRQALGMSPHAYLAHQRVAQAKALLADGVPVAHVAAATGFADQSHLTRQFKRVVGVPPGHYAANRKIVQDTLS